MSNKAYIEKEAFVAEIKVRQEAAKAWLKEAKDQETRVRADAALCIFAEIKQTLLTIPPADVKPVPAGGIGEMSDGSHTFNGLYYQRMILFAALVKAYKDRAWKAYRHEDGELCFGGGWFIVGIDTPAGSYTYHYENKHFDLFECKELPVGKHWDGHTEKDVTRLLKLEPADKPAVPREMTARELLYMERRMYNDDSDAYWRYSDFVIKEEAELALSFIEKWAAEHPEEVSNGDKDER